MMASLVCKRLLLLVFQLVFSFPSSNATPTPNSPNVVLFLVDDLGYGDLGCYGNASVTTPNIDRLASEGIKFTRRYPIRNGMLRDRQPFYVFKSPAQSGGLPESEITLAEIFKDKGYATAIVGKWHLGVGSGGKFLPANQGFDYHYGIPGTHIEVCGTPGATPHLGKPLVLFYLSSTYKSWIAILGIIIFPWLLSFIGKKTLGLALILVLLWAMSEYLIMVNFTHHGSPKVCILMRNGEILEQPYKAENMTLRLVQEAVQFISENKNRPFFLYLPFLKLHSSVFASAPFKGKSGLGLHGDALMELDWSVGQVVQHLETQSVLDNTLIFLLSDNGPNTVGVNGIRKPPGVGGSTGVVANFKGELIQQRGSKISLYEGGIHVPAIMRWKGVIPPNTTSNALVSLIDVFPTVADILNYKISNRIIDGKSLLPLLRNPAKIPNHHDYTLHYCSISAPPAIVLGRHKLHYIQQYNDGRCPGDILEQPIVYDLQTDPGEQNPLPVEETIEISQRGRQILDSMEKSLPKQISSEIDSMVLPWLFPCANFPYCQTEGDIEDDFSHLDLPE